MGTPLFDPDSEPLATPAALPISPGRLPGMPFRSISSGSTASIRSPPWRAAYPISATAPHCKPEPRAPDPRRKCTSESSQALAAECGDWPAESIRPAMEEFTKKARSGAAWLTA